LVLTSQEFTIKFKGSPVKRTKRRGYLRNVAVALGNAGNPDGLPILKAGIDDPEPLIRGHAAWALGEIGSEAASEILEQARLREQDETVRDEILNAQEKIRALLESP
jgi:epoxyqueuosine reductase